jgi:nicotinate-nucleotide adenylyltransferase
MKTSVKKPIGILGGTFSPIHYGHLKPAQEILNTLDLAEIRLMPSHKPPHKKAPGVCSKQRAEMAQIACADIPKFSVDLRELNRDEPSYTAVTLQQIKDEMPNQPICFLMGMDSLLAFKKWYQWPEILKRCHLVVSYRPGWVLDEKADIADLLAERQTTDIAQLHQTSAGLIYLTQTNPLDISATQIRHNVQNGLPTSGLMPGGVRAYIDEFGLYC